MCYRTILLIASHLENTQRYKYLIRALHSINDQTENLDEVYISYSGPRNIDEEEKWKKIISKINIFHIESKTSQFQHYQYLSEKVKDTDVVMFIDDDDLYDPCKVSIVKKEFNKDKSLELLIHKWKHVYDNWEKSDTSRIEYWSKLFDELYKLNTMDNKEYWAMCIKGFRFKEFFNRGFGNYKDFDELIDKHKSSTDLAFSVICQDMCKHNTKIIDDALYYYRLSFSLSKDYF